MLRGFTVFTILKLNGSVYKLCRNHNNHELNALNKQFQKSIKSDGLQIKADQIYNMEAINSYLSPS